MSMVKLLRHCGGRSDSRGDGEDGGGRRVAGSPATLVMLAVAVATQHFRWLGWRAVSDKDLVINGSEHSI